MKRLKIWRPRSMNDWIRVITIIGLLLLLSISTFAQRNLYVKQLSADSVKARVDTLNFPYNFSGPFSAAVPTIAVNDTLLHEWVQNQGGGGAIPSNPDEILMNVAGTNQGQPELTYDPASNVLNVGGGGGIPTGLASDRIISTNAVGNFRQIMLNAVPIGSASPGAGQDGQVLQWNNAGGTWDYTTVGGNFWPLSGTGNISGATNIMQSSSEGVTGLAFDNLRNFFVITNDNATTQTRNTFRMQQPGGAGLELVRLSPDNINNYLIQLNDNGVNILTGSVGLGRGYSITIPSAAGTDFQIEDFNASPEGILYNADYSATFTDRSLVDKAYVDNTTIPFQQTITSAQILTGNTTPIQLITAPGASNMVQITSPITFYMVFGTTAYATNTSVDVIYNGGIQIATSSAILAAVADEINIEAAVVANTPATNVLNRAVEFQVNTGDPTLGDGDLVISFTYRIDNF